MEDRIYFQFSMVKRRLNCQTQISRIKKVFFTSFQLYELSDDPKRKEFLDDLFAFMQKRGELFRIRIIFLASFVGKGRN